MNNKKRFPAFPIVICSCMLLLSAVFAFNIAPEKVDNVVSVFSSENTKIGGFRMEVLDGVTNLPISGATVVLPETNETYVTDENGKTPEIKLTVSRDTSFDSLNKKNWGEVTVFVYADGYLPYGLFDMRIEPGKLRNGPTALMFSKENSETGDPIVLVEGPERLWANSLITSYIPQ